MGFSSRGEPEKKDFSVEIECINSCLGDII